jgi:hypothetical protein
MTVYRSMVDHGRWRNESSPEEGHTGVPVSGTSPWRLGEQEEETGILTEVFDGWCGDGGRPAAGLHGGGTKSSEERHEELRGAALGGMNVWNKGQHKGWCERGLYIGSGRGSGGDRGGSLTGSY